HRLVKISGVARDRVVPTFRRLPKDPIHRDWSAVRVLAPRAAMITQPMRKASSTDSTGTARFMSLAPLTPPPAARAGRSCVFFISLPSLLAGHGQTDLLNWRVLAGVLAHDLSLEHDQDAVGHLQDLVEVRADEQHGAAGVPGLDHGVVDVPGGADVQPPGGVDGDEQVRPGLQLPGQDDLLLV